MTKQEEEFSQGMLDMKDEGAIKGNVGYFKTEIPIYDLIAIGNKIIIRYNYDLDMNSGGAGPFDYIEFEVPIEVVKKEE